MVGVPCWTLPYSICSPIYTPPLTRGDYSEWAERNGCKDSEYNNISLTGSSRNDGVSLL